MYGSKTEQDQGNFSSCFDTIWNLKKNENILIYPESIIDLIVLIIFDNKTDSKTCHSAQWFYW